MKYQGTTEEVKGRFLYNMLPNSCRYILTHVVFFLIKEAATVKYVMSRYFRGKHEANKPE